MYHHVAQIVEVEWIDSFNKMTTWNDFLSLNYIRYHLNKAQYRIESLSHLHTVYIVVLHSFTLSNLVPKKCN